VEAELQHGPESSLPSVPRYIPWLPPRVHSLLAFLLTVGLSLGISWVTGRYSNFASLAWWEAGGLILAYALGPCVVVGTTWFLVVAIRRLRQYEARCQYGDRIENELAQSNDQLGRLNEVISNLIIGRNSTTFEIVGATPTGTTVDLVLKPIAGGAPAVGDRLLIASSLNGDYLGICSVIISRSDNVRARVETGHALWLGHILGQARRYARVETVAIAVPLTSLGERQ
jgi:hypothetical protein